MRAPPASNRPMIGARAFIAMSCTLMIFCAWVSRQRAAEHGEVLGEHEDGAAVDGAPAGDDAVAGDLRSSPCRTRSSGARRTCRIPRTSPCRAAARCARARSACRACAAPRCASRRRRGVALVAPVFELVEDVFHGSCVPAPFPRDSSKRHTMGPSNLSCRASVSEARDPYAVPYRETAAYGSPLSRGRQPPLCIPPPAPLEAAL